SLLMINNLVITVAATIVLLGTLFPLVMDALSLGKYSVGPPYFNAVFVPLMALLMPFMTIGPISRWRQDSTRRWLHELLVPALALVILAPLISGLLFDFNLWVALAVLLAGWVVVGVLKDMWQRLRIGASAGLQWRRLSPSYLGMTMAHIGFAAVVVGAVVVTQHSEEQDLRMTEGESAELGGYRFEMTHIGQEPGANYIADQAVFLVTSGGQTIATLVPEQRRYLASGQVMTEAAIDAGIFRDLYIALGEPIGERAWAVRLQYKPMVRWLWIGAFLIGIGALITSLDRRYRVQVASRSVSDSALPQGTQFAR
ncbi:MAG: cytochrome c-type biogenesis CcmF C-terminal domain-containing protein, partial [Halieaceae bacterium]